MALYSKLKLAELKETLRSRDLPATGTKPYLIERLREADWQKWKRRHPTFHQFAKLAREIQIMIWRLSLPGPRTLCMRESTDTKRLHFPKKHHTPNPAALSVCQTSRQVALERYKLVFGTSHVYADLPGGDILYHGPWNKNMCLEALWSCQPWLGSDQPHPPMVWKGLSPPVIADMNQVTHLALHVQNMADYEDMAYVGVEDSNDDYPNYLRNLLRGFEGLKKVSLVACGSDMREYCKEPGQIVIREDPKLFKGAKSGQKWDKYMMDEPCFSLEYNFHNNPSEAELQNGMPEIQIAEAFRILDSKHPISQPAEEFYVR